MIYSMLKLTYKKEESRQLVYRDYKNFSPSFFESNLNEALEHTNNQYENFEQNFVKVLDIHASKKIKVVCGKNKPHVNKALRHAIMKGSHLKNKANKTKNETDIKNYKKQRNFVVKLNKQAKKSYFNKLNTSINSKHFLGKMQTVFHK